MQEKEGSLDYKKELEQKWMNLIFIHKGRMNGLDFFFLNVCLNGAQKIVEYDTGVAILNWLLIAMSTFFAYIGICGITKRFRDIGISGWFSLPYIVVTSVFVYLATNAPGFEQTKIYWFTGLIGTVVTGLTLVFWPSQKRDNKYGSYDRAGLFRTPMKK